MPEKNILLTGIPRSGTTWLAKILTANGEMDYVHEPDNETHTYSALYYKRNMPRFPFIKENEPRQNYYKLFHHAFNEPYFGIHSFSNKVLFGLARFNKENVQENLVSCGYNPSKKFYPVMGIYPLLPKESKRGSKRLVKSVHCILALEYLLKKFNVTPIIILRHPASIISSYIDMNNIDMDVGLYRRMDFMQWLFGKGIPDHTNLKTPESLAGYQVALFYKAINNIAETIKSLHLVFYENMLEKTIEKIKDLYDSLDLQYTEEVGKFIQQQNKKGEGYETSRIAEKQKDIWKERLSDSQINEIIKGYRLFEPVFYKEFQ